MGAWRLGPALPKREGLSRLPFKLAADGALKHIGIDEGLPVAVWRGPRSRSEIDIYDGEGLAGDVRQALLKHRRDRLGFTRSGDSEDREADACSDQSQ